MIRIAFNCIKIQFYLCLRAICCLVRPIFNTRSRFIVGSIKKNAVYNVLLAVSQVLFPLITFPYISRVLLPQGVGAYTFVDNYTQYFVLVAALGIPVYGIREIARSGADAQLRSRVFTELITLHFLSSLVLAILYVCSFLFITRLQPHTSLFLIGSVLLMSSVFLIEWYYQGIEAFPYITIRTLCIRCLTIIAIFTFVKRSEDLIWYYAINVGGVVVNASVNWWHSKKSVQLIFSGLRLRRHIKPLLFIFSTVFVTNVYTLLDSVLLGFLSSDEQVGYYTVAVKVSKILIMLLSAISAVLVPPLSLAIKEGAFDRAKNLLKKSYAYICYLSIPLVVLLFVSAAPLITIFAGSAYTTAILPLQILSPTIFIVGMNYLFGMQILNPTGNERYFFRTTVIGMIISIALNILLIPHLASTGAAIANLGVEFTVMLLSGYFALKKFNFGLSFGKIVQALLASVPIFVLSCIMPYCGLSAILSLVFIGSVGILLYVLIQHYVWKNLILGDLLMAVSLKRRDA